MLQIRDSPISVALGYTEITTIGISLGNLLDDERCIAQLLSSPLLTAR